MLTPCYPVQPLQPFKRHFRSLHDTLTSQNVLNAPSSISCVHFTLLLYWRFGGAWCRGRPPRRLRASTQHRDGARGLLVVAPSNMHSRTVQKQNERNIVPDSPSYPPPPARNSQPPTPSPKLATIPPDLPTSFRVPYFRGTHLYCHPRYLLVPRSNMTRGTPRREFAPGKILVTRNHVLRWWWWASQIFPLGRQLKATPLSHNLLRALTSHIFLLRRTTHASTQAYRNCRCLLELLRANPRYRWLCTHVVNKCYV